MITRRSLFALAALVVRPTVPSNQELIVDGSETTALMVQKLMGQPVPNEWHVFRCPKSRFVRGTPQCG